MVMEIMVKVTIKMKKKLFHNYGNKSADYNKKNGGFGYDQEYVKEKKVFRKNISTDFVLSLIPS